MTPASASAHTSVQSLGQYHALLLPPSVDPGDVVVLLSNFFPALEEPVSRALDGLGVSSLEYTLDWRLSRHSHLFGPVYITSAMAKQLELPTGIDVLYALQTPRDREEAPPPPWIVESSELAPFFPYGLPEREEARMLEVLVALARRLHVSIRLADEPDDTQRSPTRILTPDPEAHVDIAVFSSAWLSARRMKAALESAFAGQDLLDFAIETGGGETGKPYAVTVREHTPHRDGQDTIRLDGDAGRKTYAGTLGGYVEVRVMEEEKIPTALGSLGACYKYEVHWVDNSDVRYLPPEHHNAMFREHRSAARHYISRIAAIVLEKTDGLAVDEAGLLVARSQLMSEAAW